MNRNIMFVIIIGLAAAMIIMNKQKEEIMIYPPVAEKTPHQITVHGYERVDNYHWMRLTDEQKLAKDPDAQTQKVLDNLQAENEYKEINLKHTEKFQDKLFDEIVGRIKKDDESVPYLDNDYWYYTRYEKDKEYPIHCRKKESLDNAEEIMIDVNEWAQGHDYYSLRGLSVSPDNKYLAFSVDTLSRRIYTIMVKDLQTGEILEDEIKGTEGGTSWAMDSQTFFYTVKNEVTLLSEHIDRHKLGTPQSKDVRVYTEKDNTFYIGVYRSKSDKYMIIYNGHTLVNEYHILEANNPEGEFRSFSPREEVHEYSIEHYKDKFYIVTNWDATNFRLMQTPDSATAKENWTEVIAHREDVLLSDIEVFTNHMVISERKDGLRQLRVIDQRSEKEHYMDFGEAIYSAFATTNPSFDTNILRYSFSSMKTPYSTLDYNMDTRESTLLKQTEVVGGHNPDDYVTERLFAPARDGKMIPISIVYKKGFKKNGKGNVLQYAYGSYGATMDPTFSSTRLSLLDRGFAFAIAHIRGSQTYGRPWYEDGKMFNKMNTFTDYIDCSKYLIQENFTSADHLFAMGGSAGGLLMGAIVNLAPQLYRGVVAAVPFVDVINTMMDETIPLTSNEWDEWGDPRIKGEYDYMMTYSPYDNVEAKDYPNMLVTTGYFDSQVQYWEPQKWVAKLRDMKTDDNILLMHVNMEAGHGGKSGRFRRYREVALGNAFMFDLVGIKR
ncbi:MAG: S9 family peptidase [Candidatus Marinimicrobia bacterium]|nr:S9 family peptidase [Candidatus Neomarinimicrobiota bacterium]